MSTTINGVSVRLGRDVDDPRKYAVTVQVYSKKRPGLKSTNVIDPGKVSGQQHLLQLIGAAGAACAEYLGEKYGDNIDPGLASKFALRAFGEEARLMAELAKDVPAKLRRLESQAFSLGNHDLAYLHHLSFLVGKNEKLLPREVAWLDARIGELHGGSL